MLVDVLIPTRERPDFLANCLRSLTANARDPASVVLHVGIDNDDTATLGSTAWREVAAQTGITIQPLIGPRPPTLHHIYNSLWRATRGAVCLGYADDQIMVTPGWDEAIREAMRQIPDGLAAGAIHDTGQPGAPTYWLLPRPWVQVIGYAMSEMFPFWFADIWVGEVAQLCRRTFAVPAVTKPQWPDAKGQTHRLRNVAFWAMVFRTTRPQRVEEARKILAHTGGATDHLETMAAAMAKTNDNFTHPFTAMIVEAMAAEDRSRFAAELKAMEILDILVPTNRPGGSQA
jgi:hypothetical protein